MSNQMTEALRSYYPPGADVTNLHRFQAVYASTPEEIAHLQDMGWIPADFFENARRQTEKAEAAKLEKQAKAAESKARHEAELKAAADAEREAERKKREALEAERQQKLSARERRVQFLITAAKAQKTPLEDRNRDLSFRLTDVCQKMAFAHQDDQIALAQQIIDMHKERDEVRAKLAAIDRQLGADVNTVPNA